MKVIFSKDFFKKYKKVDVRIRHSVDEALEVFKTNPLEPMLRNHELRNKWKGHRSINITADYRAIYQEKTEGNIIIAYFAFLGTHKELYK